jgi:hypothetical protein
MAKSDGMGANTQLEAVAADLLIGVETNPPVSSLNIAERCGFAIATPNWRNKVRGPAVFVDFDWPQVQQEEECALHLAHWRLVRSGHSTTSEVTEYVARAIMLPYEPFLRDMRHTQDVRSLQRIHRYASARFIEQRLVDLATARPLLRVIVTGASDGFAARAVSAAALHRR